MIAGTADMTASIRIRMSNYRYAEMLTATDCEKYIRSLMAPMRYVSDYAPEARIYIPSPIKPAWFANIQKRIRASVKSNYRAETNDGQWISQEVADAAGTFFLRTADLLPGEPFIYSSRLGDLVAEFKGEHGTMTSIVSPTFALLFALIDGVSVERRVFEDGDVREEIRQLTGMLRMGLHGAMDTTR